MTIIRHLPQMWADIPSYEDLYQISSSGDVRSLPKLRKNEKGTSSPKSKILKQSKMHNGYLTVTLWKNNIKKTCLIHRLLAETFLLNENNLREVNHKNGDKSDNRIENLEWVSHSDNMKHAIKNGLLIYRKTS